MNQALQYLHELYMLYQKNSLDQIKIDVDRNWTAKDEKELDECEVCGAHQWIYQYTAVGSFDEMQMRHCAVCKNNDWSM